MYNPGMDPKGIGEEIHFFSKLYVLLLRENYISMCIVTRCSNQIYRLILVMCEHIM